MKFLFFLFGIGISSLIMGQSRDQLSQQYYDSALQEYRQGDYRQALVLVGQGKQYQLSPQITYLEGLILEAQSEPKRAVAAYEATVLLDPGFQEAYFQKALIYLNQGDPEQAIRDFNYLINGEGVLQTRSVFFEIDPSGVHQNAIMSLVNLKSRLYYYRGKAYQLKGNHAAAFEDFNMAIDLEPKPEYFLIRGLLHQKNGHSELAQFDFRRGLDLDPDNELLWYNLALENEATVIPTDILEKPSFAPILDLLAARAIELEQYDQARSLLDRRIALDLSDALALINRGRILTRLKWYQPAILDFERAFSLDPGRSEALYLIGNIRFYQKAYEAALGYYNQYLAIDPGYGLVWYNGAMAHLELNNDMEACHFLRQAIRLGMLEAEELIDRFCQED